jgi:hypothetical protein
MNFNRLIEKYLSNTYTDMKTVFINLEIDKGHFTIYPYFFKSEREEEFTQYSDWIGSYGGGLPSFTEHYDNGEYRKEYHQYGDGNDKFPLIYIRDFYSIKKPYIDILEEFVLYFNLYKDGNNFILIDDGGNENVVITIDDNKEVKIKTNLLMEFMSIKNYSLSLNFDFVVYDYEEDLQLNYDDMDCDYYKSENQFGEIQSSIGKKIIRKPSKVKTDTKSYEEFIIGVDEYGDNIEFSCNHNILGNIFGGNKENPQYLTPIFFKKEVLTKYYSQTEKYSVGDGGVSCGGLWFLRCDMNNPNYITSYLGDLGRDLPYTEQKYWKHYNIPPNGTISEVEFNRSFMVRPTDPTDEVLYFRDLLYKLNGYWNKEYGFNLFKPLNESDSHYYKSFRIPLTNEQKDFDEQLSSLSKIILESINIKEINKYFKLNSIEVDDDLKGINRLKLYIKSIGYNEKEVEDKIGYFNMMYDLRSKLTAHRKSEKVVNKELEKHQLIDKDNKDKMRVIMDKVNNILKWLIKEEE